MMMIIVWSGDNDAEDLFLWELGKIINDIVLDSNGFLLGGKVFCDTFN